MVFVFSFLSVKMANRLPDKVLEFVKGESSTSFEEFYEKEIIKMREFLLRSVDNKNVKYVKTTILIYLATLNLYANVIIYRNYRCYYHRCEFSRISKNANKQLKLEELFPTYDNVQDEKQKCKEAIARAQMLFIHTIWHHQGNTLRERLTFINCIYNTLIAEYASLVLKSDFDALLAIQNEYSRHRH